MYVYVYVYGMCTCMYTVCVHVCIRYVYMYVYGMCMCIIVTVVFFLAGFGTSRAGGEGTV